MVQTLHKEILACRQCHGLFGFEPAPMVFGEQHSKIFQIGQAPSKSGHYNGKPFDDPSGKRLRQWYELTDEQFYDPSKFYFTAISHCFPGKNGKGGGDKRPPSLCADKWLHKEIELVQNELYLIVGRNALDYLLPKSDFLEMVFEGGELNGKPLIVIPHPSPLNIKWLKDNPRFLTHRLPEIREEIHHCITQSSIVNPKSHIS